MSKKSELLDIIREKDPDTVCLAKNKLSDEGNFKVTGHNVWKKDREEGRVEGVMVLVKCGLKVTKVEYGEDKAEIVLR